MLGAANDSLTFDEAWESLPQRAPLPSEGFLVASGVAPSHPSERRRFVRFRCRTPAILYRNKERLAGYTADISRSGMGIISPVQIFPHECVEVVTHQQSVSLRVVRCLRLGAQCYQCACEFVRSNGA